MISRKETWGEIRYDTNEHKFSYVQDRNFNELPYVSKPVVLNCELTLKCNMACKYCVAKDMLKYCEDDLTITNNLINEINKSPFLVIVITGGEPLLPILENNLIKLVASVKNKGIVVDTNGCVEPSEKVLKTLVRKKVLVRVSLDSFRLMDEAAMRMKKEHKRPWSDKLTIEAYNQKIDFIKKIKKLGIKTSIQSVLHTKNFISISRLPEKLREWSIDKWFVQRLIPTSKIYKDEDFLKNEDYEGKIRKLEQVAKKFGIDCFTKKDRRHNCVFLMVGDGQIYTQSNEKGVKVPLGKIGKIKDYEYFSYVSSSEHASRYYDIKGISITKKG